MYLRRYSETEKAILHSAIKELDKIFPVRDSVDTTCEFYVSLWDLYAKESEEKVEYGSQGERDCVFARNVALRYLHLAMMVDNDKEDGFLLHSMIKTISDTIVSVIKLAEDGLEYQAFVMIRTLFELFMTLLITVESPEKRKAYKMAHTPEASYKVWRSDFTKAKFISMLEGYSENYPGLFEPAKKWVTESYSFLSSFVHNDSVNVMLYTKSLFDENGITHFGVWGEYVTRKGEIFRRLVEVIAPCDLLFFSMLNDPEIEISMKTILCDEKDLPGTISIYWTIDGLRKICLLLLADHDLDDKIKREVRKVNCPFFSEKHAHAD